jgi:competence protein ComEC
MALGGAAAIVGLVPALQPLAQGLAWIPWLCLTYTSAVVRWMASWPSVSLEIDHRWAIWFVLAYGALVLLVLWIYRKRRNPARTQERVASQRSSNAFLAGMAAIAVLVFLAAIQMPDGRLHVVFLDVGQGDAIFITTPSGKQVLVDGGPSPSKLTEALGRYMPFWDRSLDVVVMTHADVDHITGLAEMLARYRLSLWLDNGQPGDGAVYATCQRLLQANSVHQVSVRAGDRLDLGSGIRFEVLHPPADLPAGLAADDNDTSLVLRLVWREASFLLASDVSTRAEHLIQQSDQLLAADVLKVAHHGSEGSSSAEFLTAVNPSYAVISVGADNPFGHPGQAILERLGNVTLLRTDQQGTVELITDGHRLWVRTQR